MSRILLFFVIGIISCGAADIRFVGLMSKGPDAFIFALSENENVSVQWLSLGDRMGRFVLSSFDSKTDSLTLKEGTNTLVLRLPESQVRIAKDDIIAALQRVLNIPAASRLFDLLHPKLKPIYRELDFESIAIADINAPWTKLEIRKIPRELLDTLQSGLELTEEATGVRIEYGLWITKADGSFSMNFVIPSGPTWFLAGVFTRQPNVGEPYTRRVE